MNISIIIPSIGKSYESLKRLLKSIKNQKLDPSVTYECLIVFNGVGREKFDEIEKAIRQEYKDPWLHLLYSEDKGANVARNIGLKKALSDILLFLDDDCELDTPIFLATHIRYHLNADAFAFGGGYQLPYAAGFFDEIYNDMQSKWMQWGIKNAEDREIQFLLGGNCSIKKSLAITMNLKFDDAIVYGGTELDFFRDSERKGLKKYLISLDLLHHTHESFFSLTKKYWKQGQGGAYSDKKFADAFRPANYRTHDDNRSIVYKAMLWYLNYIYWLGYYGYQKKVWKMFPHFLRDQVGLVNRLRYRLFDQLNSKISSKQKSGKRF